MRKTRLRYFDYVRFPDGSTGTVMRVNDDGSAQAFTSTSGGQLATVPADACARAVLLNRSFVYGPLFFAPNS